jgi:hypothetical protein
MVKGLIQNKRIKRKANKGKRKAMMISDRPSPARATEKRTTSLVFITGWPIIPASF